MNLEPIKSFGACFVSHCEIEAGAAPGLVKDYIWKATQPTLILSLVVAPYLRMGPNIHVLK